MKINIPNTLLELIKFFAMFGVVVGFVNNDGWTSFIWIIILILAVIVREVEK